MVLHNPNNWHWVNKDVRDWAREYLEKNLTGVAAEDDENEAEVSKVISMEGDVDVSQRKGKVITLFDVKVQLEYTGDSSPGEFAFSRSNTRHSWLIDQKVTPKTRMKSAVQSQCPKLHTTPRKMSMLYVF